MMKKFMALHLSIFSIALFVGWWCFKKYAEKNNMAFDKIEV